MTKNSAVDEGAFAIWERTAEIGAGNIYIDTTTESADLREVKIGCFWRTEFSSEAPPN